MRLKRQVAVHGFNTIELAKAKHDFKLVLAVKQTIYF